MASDATTATSGDKIRCDACPVMCYIKPGAAGACDRYANHNGELVRVDLEFQWGRSRPIRLEEYLAIYPELSEDPGLLQAVAFEEYRLRLQAGENTTPDEYRRRFGLDGRSWPSSDAARPDAPRPGDPEALFEEVKARFLCCEVLYDQRQDLHVCAKRLDADLKHLYDWAIGIGEHGRRGLAEAAENNQTPQEELLAQIAERDDNISELESNLASMTTELRQASSRNRQSTPG